MTPDLPERYPVPHLTTVQRAQIIQHAILRFYSGAISAEELYRLVEEQLNRAVGQERLDNDRILTDMQNDSAAHRLGWIAGVRHAKAIVALSNAGTTPLGMAINGIDEQN